MFVDRGCANPAGSWEEWRLHRCHRHHKIVGVGRIEGLDGVVVRKDLGGSAHFGPKHLLFLLLLLLLNLLLLQTTLCVSH